jgi:hypothetical protein
MKSHTIAIVTPAQRGSRSGNRISAERYARLFCALGQRVRVLDAWDHKPADVLVVLNATRSARSLLAARVQYPKLAIILVLTGTDVYGRRARGRGFERVIEAADCIVGLQVQVGASWAYWLFAGLALLVLWKTRLHLLVVLLIGAALGASGLI